MDVGDVARSLAMMTPAQAKGPILSVGRAARLVARCSAEAHRNEDMGYRNIAQRLIDAQ
jgi:hypothetical protein